MDKVKVQLSEERKSHIREVFYKDLEVVMMDIKKHVNYMDKKFMCVNRQKIIQQILKKIKELS